MPAHENDPHDAPIDVPGAADVGQNPPHPTESSDQPEIPEEVIEQQLIGLDTEEILKRQDGGNDPPQK